MMKLKIGLIMSCVIAICPSPLQSLELDTYTKIIQDSHPFYKQQATRLGRHEAEQRQQHAYQDWTWTANPSYTHAKQVQTSSFSPESTTIQSVSTGLSKTSPLLGGSIALNLNSVQTKQALQSIPSLGGLSFGKESFYQNELGLQYTRPLLKNANLNLEQLGVDLKTIQAKGLQAQVAEAQEAFLLGMIQTYLQWVKLTEYVSLTKTRRDYAHNQVRQSQRKFRKNLIEKVDLLRAEDQERMVLQQLMQLESQLDAMTYEIQTNIQDFETRSPSFSIDIQAGLSVPKIEYETTREHQQLNNQLEIILRQKEANQNQSLPVLNMIVGVGVAGGNEAFKSSWDMNKNNTSIGLVYQQPIENTQSSNQEAIWQKSEEEIQYQIATQRRRYQASQVNLKKQLGSLSDIISLNQDQIQSATKRVREERRLYNQGRSQLTVVIQAKDNEQNARIRLLENQVQWHLLYYQALALNDGLENQNQK